jgi:hypothetical protein
LGWVLHVCMVKNSTDHILLNITMVQISASNCDCEMLWMEVDKLGLNTQKNYIIGTIYRRPGSNITKVNKLLADKLQTISLENKSILHMGDYNIDLLKTETHSPTSEFNDTNVIHSLFPSINKPTRVTPTSATIIDNIFTNYLDATKLTSSPGLQLQMTMILNRLSLISILFS